MEIKVTVDIPAVQALADAIRYVADKDDDPGLNTPTKEKLESEPEGPEEEIPDSPEPEEAKPPWHNPEYTLEQVRAKLAALAQAGKQKQVKSLITSFNVKKLTDVPEEKYAELMERAEELS